MRARLVQLLPLVVLCAGPAWAQTSKVLERENIVEAVHAPGTWAPATVGQPLAINDRVRTGELSRAAVQLSDSSVVRLNQRTSLTILAPDQVSSKGGIDLLGGAAYFLSREKPQEIRIRTPSANGITRGTEFYLAVGPDGKTTLTMFEGEVELFNAQGRVLVKSGEQGEVELGKAPTKTAVLYARNIIQWALYYPGVLHPRELAMTPGEERAVATSLAAYREGDLLRALEKYPVNYRPSTPGGRLYRAGVLLAVGRADQAEAELQLVPRSAPGRGALEQMMAAVNLRDWTREGEPRTASEWIAESYYRQSKSQLATARQAALRATEAAPEFGYAWVRLAELEFSFGRTRPALRALEQGLKDTPRNAQGHALRGFLLSANNSIAPARAAFEEAIRLDGALGNAWLGRGLTYIRQGQDALGRADLQTAAVLEPNRSLLHSYLGKAFSQVGNATNARKDLERAKVLDPNDPTPWLYSAIQNKIENRYNEAVRDVEQSLALNENRRVYRSQFLLDQDRAIRGTNVAAIYLNEGMVEQSVREAVRSVNSDYGSAPAHLFLANSYDALRDPTRILLRYETAWFNELLLSNLLSPVGGGPLSQFVSQQEYSKLFESDGLGISSVTDYFSYGELRETASQYGTFGNFSYALDAEYQYNNGLRPNNRISRFESYATFKFQLGPQDTLFCKTKFEDLESGDLFQRYDNREVGRETITYQVDANRQLQKVVNRNVAALTFDFEEKQEPALLLGGWHHEWAPGNHTLLLVGRLANDQVLTARDTQQILLTRDLPLNQSPRLQQQLSVFNSTDPEQINGVRKELRKSKDRGRITGFFNDSFDFDYRANFETYSAELNQIITQGPHTAVLGSRYQQGEFTTQDRLDDYANGTSPLIAPYFGQTPADQNFSVDFQRFSLYAYDIYHLTPWLSVTGGVSYDRLDYPDNFRSPPLNDRQDSLNKVSPKAGLIINPWSGATIRAAYTEGISGTSFDESIRLEPTQVAGFLQAYRTLASESLIGSVAGNIYKLQGLSLEQRLPSRTYLGVEYNILSQDIDRTIGVFDFYRTDVDFIGAVPGSLAEKDIYREDIFTATINQLLGERWSLGVRYRYTRSKLRRQLQGLSDTFEDVQDGNLIDLARNADRTSKSSLHQLSLYALYNHPSGFFARGEGNWFHQDNDRYETQVTLAPAAAPLGTPASFRTNDSGLPGDDFWQLNALIGWRFYRNQCEISCGVLNLLDTDYELEPLNPYVELPRERTVVVHCRLSF